MTTRIRSIKHQLPQAGEPPRWYAFRTMFKREKAVAKRIGATGLLTYVPLRTTVRSYKSKTVTSRVPLLSSYVFICLTAADYSPVLADRDVFELVSFNGEVGRVTEKEIAFLKEVLQDGGDAHQVELSKEVALGAEVVIAGGALAGTKGRVIDANGSHNFLVELRTLGVSLRIMVREEHLMVSPVI